MTVSTAAAPAGSILAINGGSSTLKFALFRAGAPPARELSGSIDRIGMPNGTINWVREHTGTAERRTITASDHVACLEPLLACIKEHLAQHPLVAIGHRVVHGGRYREPQRVAPVVMEELERLRVYDPEHLPAEIELIHAFAQRYPHLQQVACFDTAFHRDMPRVARLLPIPRRYEQLGLQRYGFHGLSYAFLMRELEQVGTSHEVKGRIILAHLGNGASMAAVKNGQAVDTTMSFTPTSGLPMSRRSGDLDPGLVAYLARTEGMSADQFHTMVNTESGLLGVSEISSDMRDLLKEEQHDPRAAEAVALFCYQAKKWIGALTAALGGLETLIFTAGIGEHSPVIRARICDRLEFLGVALDHARNEAGAPVISQDNGKVTVRVMHTDEESEIARAVSEQLGKPKQ
ncbi:MAG: acetate/propionate family kinase [Nitrospira sp.]|nr:acetate/propionate family kinase [Nitrospira sp.]MDH4305057.1 acetate/propionate family kinase [Nitrospira sp.]MDH5194604.1 acetate/propionate family kinase [Nitrospira sp.]